MATRIAGIFIIVISSIFAAYVHSLFPQKHESPKDFDHLLTDGPYKYVRYPFYSAFIIMGFGITLCFVSIPGIILNGLLILLWKKLPKARRKNFFNIGVIDIGILW